MPEIKRYTRQVNPAGRVNVGDTSGAFGGGTGRAVQDIGAQLGQYAEKKAKSDYISQISKFQLDNVRRQEELSKQDFDPDVDLSAVYQQDFEERASQLNISPLVSNSWQQDFEKMRLGFAESGLREGARRESVRVKENWEDTVTNLTNNIAIGGSVDDSMAMLNEAASALPQMSSEDRNAILGDARDRLVEAGVESLISRNPYDFKKRAKNGDFSDVKNLSAYMRSADAEIKSREAQVKKRNTEIKNQVTSVKDRLSRGFEIPKQEWGLLRQGVASTGDKKLVSYLQSLQASKETMQVLRKQSPVTLQSYINEVLLPATREDGASEQEIVVLDMAEKMLAKTQSEIKEDVLSWSARTGSDVPALNMQEPESMKARVTLAKSNAENYNVPVRPLTNEEADAFINDLDDSAVSEQFVFLNALRSGAGEDAIHYFRQLGEKDNILAHTGGLLVATSDTEATKKILQGRAALKQNPDYKPNSNAVNQVFYDYVGDAFRSTPMNEKAVKDAAVAHYIGSGGKIDFTGEEFNSITNEDFKRSINAVTGIDLEAEGFYEANDMKTMVPVGSSAEDFELFLEGADDFTYKAFSVDGGEPYYKGKKVSPSALKQYGGFEMVESGVYRIKIRNGSYVQDSQTGEEYRIMLDAKAIELIGGGL